MELLTCSSTWWRRQWQPTPVFLPGESQGRGSLVGCRLWGRTESDTTEATQHQQQQRYWMAFFLNHIFILCIMEHIEQIPVPLVTALVAIKHKYFSEGTHLGWQLQGRLKDLQRPVGNFLTLWIVHLIRKSAICAGFSVGLSLL